jgi:thiopeptide-type bacteriocin biosynthesis protein
MAYESTFFLLRTPLLPFKKGLEIFEPAQDQTKYLKDAFQDPLLQESIFLASEELHQQLLRYLKDEIKDPKKIISLEESLVEYILRMSSRCTPFGIFAGISVGHFESGSKIKLCAGTEESLSRKLRLDNSIISELVRYYEKQNDFRSKSIYTGNSSLYKVGRKYRYHEYTIKDGYRKYELNEIDYFPALAKIIKQANHGISFNAIEEILVSDGFDRKDSEAYIHQLIDSQVLISEIEPTVVGSDFFDLLVEKVKCYQLDREEELVSIQHLLNDNSFSNRNRYIELSEILNLFGIQNKKKGFVQVDLNREVFSSTLDREVTDNLFTASQVLVALNPINRHLTNLEVFKKAFLERYDREAVSLVKVMDIEIGINYKNLQDYTSNVPAQASTSIEHIKKFKKNKLHQAIFKGEYEVEITDEELERLGIKLNPDNLPQSFSIMAKVINEKGNKFQLDSITGPSHAKLLGRFCNSNEDLKVKVEEMGRLEQELYPEQVLAEIVHLPQDRIGNVLNRPHLSNYEITYLGKSRLPQANQINVSDLYLRMDNQRLVLFSKRLGKEIIPRLTSAHNYVDGSLPIYHFLSEMQMQYTLGGVRWMWNDDENEKYLPKVRYKNIILSPAIWNISLKDLTDSRYEPRNLADTITALKQYFIDKKIDKYVYHTVRDNKLLIDTSSTFGLNYLAKKLFKHKYFILTGKIFDPNDLLVKSEEGGFVNEVIIPFVQHPKQQNAKIESKFIFPSNLRRNFEPGSEWVYYKVYLGNKTSNFLLYKTIFPLVKELLRTNIIKSWFFIRYADPKYHLRIRFLLEDINKMGDLVKKFNEAISYYLKNSLIASLQIDTYVREVERYGEKTIELSERYFSINSSTICKIFQQANWDDKKFKCQLAFQIIHDLLTNLFSDMLERHELVNAAVEHRGLGKIAFQKSKKESYNKRYRTFIAERLNFQAELESLTVVKKALLAHKQFVKENLLSLTDKKNKYNSKQIVLSYIHMFVNRLYDEHQNEMEGLLYFYLEKQYRSTLAKDKKLSQAANLC